MKRAPKNSTTLFLTLLFALATLFLGLPTPGAENLPDLTVGQVKVETAPGYPGKCWVKVELKNVGNGALSASDMQNGRVEFTRNDGLNNRYSLGAFRGTLDKPGGSVWVSPPGTIGDITPGKTWTLTVEMDPYKRVRESNENNNKKTFTLTCNALPDLAITRIYTKPAYNGGCEVWAEVKNVGNFNLPKDKMKNFSIRFYVGKYNNGYLLGALRGSEALKVPGGTLQVIAPGNLYVTETTQVKVTLSVYRDSDGIVWDANSHNNEKIKTLSCSSGKQGPKPVIGPLKINLKRVPTQSK